MANPKLRQQELILLEPLRFLLSSPQFGYIATLNIEIFFLLF